jgi:hypothetical protein
MKDVYVAGGAGGGADRRPGRPARRTGAGVDDRRLDRLVGPAPTHGVKRAALLLLLAGATVAQAAPKPLTIDPFTFVPPEGWKVAEAPDKITLTEERPEGDRFCMVAVFAGVEGSGNLPADFAASWRKILNQGADSAVPSIQKARLPSGVEGLTAEGAVKIGDVDSYAVLFVTAAGARFAAIAVLTSGQEALDACRPQVDGLLASVSLGGAPAAAPAPEKPKRLGKPERVPESSFKDGVPRGIFFATSMLSGKAVCLLFLDGGRITREIPEGGLEELYWEQHLKDNPRNSGTYTVKDGTLTISWGDGGVHTGPIKATPEGIEFYGKRYVKPAPTTVEQLAGAWQSALTSGAMTTSHELTIGADGAFHWTGGTGGSGDGWAAFGGARDVRGKLTLRGSTATFRADNGSVETFTFLRMPGDPATVFSVGRNMFARK